MRSLFTLSMVTTFLAMYACTKDTPKPEPVAASATASVAASASVAATATATDTASAAATDTTSATATASVAGKPSAKPGGELPGAVGMTSKGTNYEVIVPAPKTCEKAGDCTLVVRVTAGSGFHVNKEYPTKLTLDDVPNVEMLGKDAKGKNVFSKAAGDFVFDGEQVGTMNAKLKSNASGLTTVGGTFKFSVCSQANCQTETTQVKATIPVR